MSSRTKLTTATLSLALAFFFSQPALAQMPAPKLVVEKPMIEVEDVVRGTSTVVEFVLDNQGNGPLEILQLESSCSCATVDVQRTIPANSKATLKATVDTIDLGGGINLTVQLLTNDFDTPQMTLTAKVTLENILAVTSGRIRYIVHENFPGDSSVDQLVFAVDNSDFEILEIDSPFSHVTVSEPRPATEDERMDGFTGTQWIFSASLDRKAPIGPLRGSLMVHTSHPKQKRVPVELSGFVRPVIVATPPSFAMRELQMPEDGVRMQLHLKQFGEQPIEIESVTANVEGVRLSARELVPGREWQVIAAFDSDLPPGRFRAIATVKTTSEFKPVFEIPITGRILPRSEGAGER